MSQSLEINMLYFEISDDVNKNYMAKSIVFLLIFFSSFSFAQQEDILKDIDTIQTKGLGLSPSVFNALQIAMGQSTKLPAKNE